MGRLATVTPLAVKRRKIYIALEDLDFIWDEDDIPGIERLWNEGFSLIDIAKACDREPAEVFLLLMDLDIKGRIKPRPGGIFGTKRSVWKEDR